MAHGDASAAVGDVAQVQSERLARAQAAVEHQAHQRQVAPAAQRAQQRRDLVGVERPRQALDRLDAQGAPGRLLAGDAGQEGAVPVDGAHQRAIHDPRNRVRAVELPGQDRPVIKRRHSRERPIDRGGTQTG
jgi:hypothetical protein